MRVQRDAGRFWSRMRMAAWTMMGATVLWAPFTRAQAPDEETAYLKQRVFRIPIEVATEKNEAIRELRLYVSSDRGATWTRVANVPPSQKTFTFRARVDGEYWFGLSYVDDQGNVEPSDMRAQPPGLKVVVDTAVPVIQLRPATRTEDKASLQWRIMDDHPVELGSLRMEIRDKRDGKWQELYPEAMLEGTVDWPARPDQSFVLRATLKDRAGNEGTAEVEIPGGQSPAGMPAPSETTNPAPGNPAQAEGNFLVPPPPSMSQQPAPQQIPQAMPMPPSAPAPMAQAMPQQPAPSYSTAAKPASYTPSAPMNSEPPQTVFTAVPVPSTPSPTPTPNKVPPSPTPSAHQSLPQELVTSTAVPVRQMQQHVAKKPAAPAPPAQRIPLIGSTHFAVDYTVRGVGPAGVGKVELYYTKDNGVQWQLLGEDADRTPPFEVELPGEGRYGLQIVVTSPAGNGQRPPQSGEAPTIQVEVDTTAPEADFYRTVPDPESNDALLIRWASRDAHMTEHPVRLYYSESMEGPWEQIATDLPATGAFSWHVPPRTPYQVYLKMVITDMCHNESAAVTPEPVLVDLSKPEAEVIGIAILPEGGATR